MKLKRLFMTLAAVSLGTLAGQTVQASAFAPLAVAQPLLPAPPHGPSAPSIGSQPQSLTVDSGNPAVFSVTASGTAPLGYQWRKNGSNLTDGGNISGLATSTLSLSTTLSTDAGSYTVVVTNSAGSATSSAAILTVIFVPPSITGQPCSVEVSNTGTAVFTVFAAGSPPLSYQWLKEAAPLAGTARIVGTTSSALTVNDATVSDAGPYSVVISNSGVVITSAPALLTVEVPDKKSLTVSITSPVANAKLGVGPVTLTGTARSGIGVAEVWYQLNGGGWTEASTANHWSNWTASIVLATYTNRIEACAADAAGKLSAIKAETVTYEETAPLLERVSGFGTFTPNLSGKLLQNGKTYCVTAKPKPGNVFTYWDLAINGVDFDSSSSPALKFVMQSGLQLTA